jgi:hypothetical protein
MNYNPISMALATTHRIGQLETEIEQLRKEMHHMTFEGATHRQRKNVTNPLDMTQSVIQSNLLQETHLQATITTLKSDNASLRNRLIQLQGKYDIAKKDIQQMTQSLKSKKNVTTHPNINSRHFPPRNPFECCQIVQQHRNVWDMKMCLQPLLIQMFLFKQRSFSVANPCNSTP